MWRRDWPQRLFRTVLAALVISLVGVSVWFLLRSAPEFRDLWLVLAGVVGAGAVGAWRAEVDAEVRENDFRRELSLRRIEETIRWVDAEATYIWERAGAAQRGERLGYGTRQPVVLGSLWLAGDAGVLMQWLRARDDLLNRPDPIFTMEESELLRDVSIRLTSAFQDQLGRLWRRVPLREISPSEREEIIGFLDSTLSGSTAALSIRRIRGSD